MHPLQSFHNRHLNPSITIRFDVPKAAEVSLVIYNSLGQIVRTLLEGRMEAGHQQTNWDGTDDMGNQVANGLYIYRFKAGPLTHSKKMLLLR